MKKQRIISFLCIAALLLCLSGCKSTENQGDIAPTADTNAASEDQNVEVDADDAADEAELVSDSTSDLGETVAGAYGRFVEAKSLGYEKLTAEFEKYDELAMASLILLPVVMTDLAALPLTFVQDDDAASIAAAEMLGFNDISIERNGTQFVLTSIDTQGTNARLEGDFDKASDSVTCDMYSNEQLALTLEFVKGDKGYAGQYYTVSNDGSYSLIKVATEGEAIGIGITDNVAGMPKSIFKAHPGSFDFVKDCESYFIAVDGKVDSRMDGIEKVYE